MNIRLGSALASALVLTVGLVVMAGLLIGEDFGLLSTLVERGAIRTLAALFIQVTTTTIAVTILIGVFNLLAVHTRRLVRRQRGMLYSLVTLISFLAALLLYLTRSPWSEVLLEDVQVAIESALVGLLYFALVYGAYRMLHRRVTLAGVWFILVVLIVLLGSLTLPGTAFFAEIKRILLEIPVSAGARGILLGIALATIVTGVRVLLGQDRSYRE